MKSSNLRVMGPTVLLVLSACQASTAVLTAAPSPTSVSPHAPKPLPSSTLTPFLPATPVPSQTPEPTATITPTPTETHPMTITIVYDNNAYDPRLTTAWGFSALVESMGHTILFDTGGDSPTLLNNMRILEIDPSVIEHVVLSHIHGDHIGGLEGLLAQGIQPTVHLPPSFDWAYKNRIGQITTVVEVVPGQLVVAEIYTTGEMGTSIREQALVVKTSGGLVVITGCAHPGIVQIAERAQELFGGPIHLVMGGFHLGSKSVAQIETIISGFRSLGVERVAPCHCTGDLAIQMFRQEYGDDFIQAGVGRVIVIEP